MTTEPVAYVYAVSIFRGHRRVKVYDPVTGEDHGHGAGICGENFLTYMGSRASDGYRIELPEILSAVRVRLIATDEPVSPKTGRYPTRVATLADLQAPDLDALLAEEGTK